MTIAQITDIHYNDFMTDAGKSTGLKNLSFIVRDLLPRGIARVVLTGDYGAPGKFGEITGLLENNGLAYSYILGNHDSGATRFFKEFIGGALFFFLDSSSGHYHAEHLVQDGQITQYVTPSALLQIEKLHDKIEIASCNFGYRIITVEEEIRSEVVWLKEINQEK